jgi:hypothetical protein
MLVFASLDTDPTRNFSTGVWQKLSVTVCG